MRIKNVISMILVLIIQTLCLNPFADSNNAPLIDKAREHLKEHSIIDDSIVEEMAASIEYSFGYVNEVVFHYYSFSEPVITVSFNEQGDIVHCTCSQLTEERYARGLKYIRDMWEPAIATSAWEKEYGPSELWGVKENAAFYEQYHYYPKETQTAYELAVNDPGCTLTPIDHITSDDALSIANQILIDHFYCSNEKISMLRTGITLIRESANYPMMYIIMFYSGPDQQLELEYVVRICSENGLCFSAELKKEPYEVMENRRGEGTQNNTLDGLYWSEYFDMIQLEDGSYWRVKKTN